jgi:hypothetical protein
MREGFLLLAVALLLSCFAEARQSTTKPSADDGKKPPATSDANLNDFFQSRIKAEWDALKSKDKKAYGALLADGYQGVEVDGKGERTKIQAMNEIADSNVFNYTIWGFKLIPLGADAAFVIYEVTLEFPPKSALRYSRVYITELWVKHGAEWKELHYQETHVK